MEGYQPETSTQQGQGTGEAPVTYGSYQYTNEQYVSDRYSYQSAPAGGSEGYGQGYEPYQTQTPAKKQKKKKSGAGAVIGILAVLLLVVALVVTGVVFLGFRGTPRPGSTTTAVVAEVTDQEADKPETPANSGGTSDTPVTTIRSTDVSIVTTDVTEVVENVLPCVVIIDNNFTARQRTIYGVYEEEAMGTGSGVIIGKSETELLIVTNNHVVSGANTLQVQFIDGERADAEIKGTNAGNDLAVVSVKLGALSGSTQDAIRIVTLGDSDSLRLGEPVIAIGNALGYGQSVTTGVVSALNREVTMQDGTSGVFIQTDAAINEGNSGGALLNSKGELIGINTAKLGGSTVEGMGFAIPITQARERIERLMNIGSQIKYNESEKGYLGITVMTPQGIKGAYVQTVVEGSAADKGGMEEGDIIIAIDDIEISSRDDLLNALNYYPAGERVTVTVQRRSLAGENEIKLNITLQSAT